MHEHKCEVFVICVCYRAECSLSAAQVVSSLRMGLVLGGTQTILQTCAFMWSTHDRHAKTTPFGSVYNVIYGNGLNGRVRATIVFNSQLIGYMVGKGAKLILYYVDGIQFLCIYGDL